MWEIFQLYLLSTKNIFLEILSIFQIEIKGVGDLPVVCVGTHNKYWAAAAKVKEVLQHPIHILRSTSMNKYILITSWINFVESSGTLTSSSVCCCLPPCSACCTAATPSRGCGSSPSSPAPWPLSSPTGVATSTTPTLPTWRSTPTPRAPSPRSPPSSQSSTFFSSFLSSSSTAP